MRIGLFSIGTLIFLIFLVIINSTPITPQEVDIAFENVDVNTLSKLDANISDANLGKFVKYTAKGVVDEFHGGYYFVSWLNTILPPMIIDNLELILILVVLAMVSPVLFYGFLLIVAIVMITHEKIKERRSEKVK